MAEAAAVVRLRKKAERESGESDGLESSSLAFPRSKTLLQMKFTQYEVIASFNTRGNMFFTSCSCNAAAEVIASCHT